MNIIFLAAGKGSRFHNKTLVNKCLLKIENKPLIKILIDEVRKTKIRNINIVTGYRSNYLKKKLEDYKNINFIFNNMYNKREMTYSLITGLKKVKDDAIISYSDILYDSRIISKIIKNKKKEIILPVLKNWKKIWDIRGKPAKLDGETMVVKKNVLIEIGNKIKKISDVKYQYMGIIFIPRQKIKTIINIYENLKNKKKIHLTNFLNILIKKKIIINTIKISKGWYEFDDYEDYNNYLKNKNFINL
jgi:choline kinase